MIDDPAIDFLRDPIVVAAVPCLHVKYRDAKPLGDDRTKRRIGIAEDQQSIGLLLQKNCFRPQQDLANLFSQGAAHYTEVMVGLSYPQFIEEYLAELVIEILPGMYKHVIGKSV